MPKQNNGILQYLKEQGRPNDLPLNVLREFQEFEKHIANTLNSYDDCPEPIAYGMKCFTKIEMLGIALILSGDYENARRCHDELRDEFGNNTAFDDGVTLLSWIFFNFPIEQSSENTIATEIIAKSPELSSELSPFINAISESRLGLYEVIKDGRSSCQIRELFTGNEIELSHTLGGIQRGGIAVVRAISLRDTWWAFGDSSEFPRDRRQTLEGMVENKMSLYFPDKDRNKSYETMMRLAGPYWFSILARDYDGDILNPDHYLSYYVTIQHKMSSLRSVIREDGYSL